MPSCQEPCCGYEHTKALTDVNGNPRTVMNWIYEDTNTSLFKRTLINQHSNDSDEGFDTCITLDEDRIDAIGGQLGGIDKCNFFYNSEGKICEAHPISYIPGAEVFYSPGCQASDVDCVKPTICDCDTSSNAVKYDDVPTDCQGDNANCGRRETCQETLSHTSHPMGGQIGVGTDNRNKVVTCNVTLNSNQHCEDYYEIIDGKGLICKGGRNNVCTSASSDTDTPPNHMHQSGQRCLIPKSECDILYNNCAEENSNPVNCLECIRDLVDCDRTRFDLLDPDAVCNVPDNYLQSSGKCSWDIDASDKGIVPIDVSGTDYCLSLQEAQQECTTNSESPWCDDTVNDKFGCDQFRDKGNTLISDGKGTFHSGDTKCNQVLGPGMGNYDDLDQCLRPKDDARGVDFSRCDGPPFRPESPCDDWVGVGSRFQVPQELRCFDGYGPEPSASNTTTCPKDGTPYVINACNQYNPRVCDLRGPLRNHMFDTYGWPTTTGDIRGDLDFDAVPCSIENLGLIMMHYCGNPQSIEDSRCTGCCDPVFSPYWDRCETEIRQDPSITQGLINDTVAFKQKCDDFMETRGR